MFMASEPEGLSNSEGLTKGLDNVSPASFGLVEYAVILFSCKLICQAKEVGAEKRSLLIF